MADRETSCTYFESPGPANTERTLALAIERVAELKLQHLLVASTSGQTGAAAARLCHPGELIVVSHAASFAEANKQEMPEDQRAVIEAHGARVLTAQHAFGGVGRAVRRKLGTYQVEEIIAYTLRNWGEGAKVACEISLMAADAGLVATGEEVVAVGGTGRGADTALVLRVANAQDFFDLRILELVCKPRLSAHK